MSDDFKLIVGLGNPGAKYQYTLHNLGFLTIDTFLSSQPDVRWQSKWESEYAKVSIGNSEIIFLKPQTFMNLSGSAVRDCMKFYKFEPHQIIVIHDEVDLELGEVRLKKGGGAGGHNGLLSIFEHTSMQDFYRIRIGVGKPTTKLLADYLLEKANKNNLLELAKQASETLESVFKDGFVKAQNNRNKKPVSA
jgi:PTH1 family peptidyl-tRNA hydrolase